MHAFVMIIGGGVEDVQAVLTLPKSVYGHAAQYMARTFFTSNFSREAIVQLLVDVRSSRLLGLAIT